MVQVIAQTGVLKDRSGTIGTASSSQLLAPVNITRQYLYVQNPVGSGGPLSINFSQQAQSSGAGGSIVIAAGASFLMSSTFVSTEPVFINGATTGQVFTAKEG